MNRNIKRYPAVWKIRHRTGNIRDHPQRYHINVGKKYGNFRQMSPHYRERRFNNPPVRSNWSYFAEKWNMGVADLDDFARYMGYRDFDEMESRISPWELYNKNKVRFKYALRKTSDKGYQYFKEQPREVVEHEIEETASVSGWLDKEKKKTYYSEQKVKKPWEMTRDEYAIKELEREATMRGITNPLKKEIFFQNKKNDEYYDRIHKRYIEKALKEGRNVPLEVIEEYPDLKKKYISQFKENDNMTSRYFIRKYGHYGNYVINKNGVVLKEKKGFYTCAKEFPNKKDAKDFIKKIKDGKYIVDDHGVIQKVIKR